MKGRGSVFARCKEHVRSGDLIYNNYAYNYCAQRCLESRFVVSAKTACITLIENVKHMVPSWFAQP